MLRTVKASHLHPGTCECTCDRREWSLRWLGLGPPQGELRGPYHCPLQSRQLDDVCVCGCDGKPANPESATAKTESPALRPQAAPGCSGENEQRGGRDKASLTLLPGSSLPRAPGKALAQLHIPLPPTPPVGCHFPILGICPSTPAQFRHLSSHQTCCCWWSREESR